MLALVAALGAARAGAAVELPIPPVVQATHVWCWIAVGEMVFRAFDVPAVNQHYQCGVVGAVAIGTARDECARDCGRCVVPGGDATTVMGMLVEYPRRVAMLRGGRVPRLFVAHTAALLPDELRRELDGGRPVVAGINPNGRPEAFGASAHVALIIGYRVVDGVLWLIVNDPYPFSPRTWPDPYLAAGATKLGEGRYAVPYGTYTNTLGWVESFLVRKDGAHVASTRRCLASTPLSESTCPAPPLAEPGTPCGCGIARGVVVDGSP